MTKTNLLATLRAKRAEWDAILATIPSELMAEPGVAGDWSVKDIIAHLSYYERWIGDRLHEQLRGEGYAPTALDLMGEARNDSIYQQRRNHSLADVLTESHQAFEQLLEGIAAHTEAFLVEPQQFEGAPQPIVIWQLIRGDVYEHYGQHIPSIKAWLAARQT